jgi:methyl-accepting chemotaxis protein
MLSVPTKATAAAWYEGAGKALAPVSILIIIIGAIIGFVAWQTGGIRIGSQVETETLAAATKSANVALEHEIGAVDEKAGRIETSLGKVVDRLNELSVITQRLNDQDRHLSQIDTALGTLNDRITNVSQNANDRMNQISDAAARLQGRLEGNPTSDIRQPRH